MALRMATPTNINLNDLIPAAPDGKQNVKWQAGDPVPDENDPEMSVRDVSAYVEMPAPQITINDKPISFDGEIVFNSSIEINGVQIWP
jgi:hypothetical protein